MYERKTNFECSTTIEVKMQAECDLISSSFFQVPNKLAEHNALINT